MGKIGKQVTRALVGIGTGGATELGRSKPFQPGGHVTPLAQAATLGLFKAPKPAEADAVAPLAATIPVGITEADRAEQFNLEQEKKRRAVAGQQPQGTAQTISSLLEGEGGADLLGEGNFSALKGGRKRKVLG